MTAVRHPPSPLHPSQQPANACQTRPSSLVLRQASRAAEPRTQIAASVEDKNEQIRRKLEMTIPHEMPPKATLSHVLKALKKLTTDATFPGIPIYVDPVGLAEANMTVESEIKLDYKDLPVPQNIKMVLTLALRSSGLSYEVRDGLLMVSTALSHPRAPCRSDRTEARSRARVARSA